MSSKYPNIGKTKPQERTLRKWFASVLEQTGGITRYVDLINKRDNKTGEYTKEANEAYYSMLDKTIRLEPKEVVQDSTIRVLLDIPSKPALVESTVEGKEVEEIEDIEVVIDKD